MPPAPDQKTPLDPIKIPPWEEEAYKQGSEACRNYSQLTMRTRTLAQQILATGVVGLGAAIATKGIDDKIIGPLFLAGGIVLLAFAFSLLFVDWHYQSAFTAIRDSLAFIESRQPIVGPWLAHLNVRTQFNDHLASYLPFLLLAVVGCASIWQGIFLQEGHPLWLWKQAWPIPAGTFLLVFFFFARRCWLARRRDNEMNRRIGKILECKGYKLNRRPCLLKYVGLNGDISGIRQPLADVDAA